jgi:hypothetical protein
MVDDLRHGWKPIYGGGVSCPGRSRTWPIENRAST